MKLRQKLSLTVSPKNEKNWYMPELFRKNTLPTLPKKLKVIKMPPEYNKNYNCFLYVLGLYKNSKVVKETKGFIFSSFIQKLIREGELREIKQPSTNAIVLYKNGKTAKSFTHGGIVKENKKIISKWSWGPTIIHSLFDVPDFYGNIVKYYKSIPKEKSLKLYHKFKKFNR